MILKVMQCAITYDNKCVISASFDNTVRMWDISNGTPIKKLKGHTNGVSYDDVE